jgi:hypothetical protein
MNKTLTYEQNSPVIFNRIKSLIALNSSRSDALLADSSRLKMARAIMNIKYLFFYVKRSERQFTKVEYFASFFLIGMSLSAVESATDCS